MATLSELLVMKASLLSALGSGALRVQHGDKSVQYRSVDELRTALGEIEGQIATAEGRKRRRQIRIFTGEGR
jgi:hypothetical protein